MKNETVTGENARRVIEGKEPIVQTYSQEELTAQKEMNDAYMLLSLIESYSMKDDMIVARKPIDEVKANYITAYTAMVNKAKEEMASQRKEQKNVQNADLSPKKAIPLKTDEMEKVFGKYSELLYQHSLQTIDVEKVIEEVKRELEEEKKEKK